MGGGGGAADADDQVGGSGGNGGGIVFMTVTGSLSGSGNIIADGNNGENTINRTNPFNATVTGRNGAGGAGGGGAIKLNVQGSITGVSLSAKGGNGGNQLITAVQNSESEGPGGGGYIGVTGSPSISMNVAGATYGTTDCTQMSAFTANGATNGRGGTSVSVLTFIGSPDLPLPVKMECFDITYINTEKVQISWTAYNETDMCCYELEQKTVTNEWATLVTQPAQNGINSSNKYSLTITQPNESTLYRIKAVSIHGLVNYTCTKALKPSVLSKIKIIVSTDKLYVIGLNMLCTFKLYNNYGQEVRLNVNKTNSFSTIDKTNLPKGVYYLQILTANDKMVYEFVK
jgi:hypothetical protein